MGNFLCIRGARGLCLRVGAVGEGAGVPGVLFGVSAARQHFISVYTCVQMLIYLYMFGLIAV